MIYRNASRHARAATRPGTLVAAIGAIAVALGTLLAQEPRSADFFKDTFDAMLRADPEFATSTGHHEFDDRWTDWSKAARDSRRQFFASRLEQLKRFAPMTRRRINSRRGCSNTTSPREWRRGISTPTCCASASWTASTIASTR